MPQIRNGSCPKRRDVANAVDTERPVDFPKEITGLSWRKFEFIATATDNSNAFDINKHMSVGIRVLILVRELNGFKNCHQEGNQLKIQVHGNVPVDTVIGDYTRYVMVTDAAGNQNVSTRSFQLLLKQGQNS